MARPARANLSGGDSALLGHRRNAAIHYSGMGRRRARHELIRRSGVAGDCLGRRCRRRNRRGNPHSFKTFLGRSAGWMLMGAALIAIAFYSRDIFPSEWSIALGPLHLPVSVLILNLFLLGVGILAGFFIVPMNALLQHRGHVLLSAGHSIAVQNFNENLSILVMLCLYAILIGLNVPIQAIIVIFGALICTVMWRVMRRR